MNIWPLGVGGWMPSYGRQTNSTLIEYKDNLILVDAGTGISNLSEYQVILNKYEEIHLILSHYHQDHVMGLFFLPKFLKNKKLTIWGPGRDFYPEGCERIISRSADQPFGTTGYETIAGEVQCKDYNSQGFEIGQIQVKINQQNHTLPSFGITFDDKLHIASDTDVNQDILKLDVQMILHECWAKDVEAAKEHASMDGLVKAYNHVLGEVKAEAIGIIHRNPSISDVEYAKWTRAPFFIVHENQRIELVD